MHCVALDLETTGVPTEEDPQAVVEVGYTDLSGDEGAWEVGETASHLTNPNRKIPAEAMSVHWITDAEVANAAEAGTIFMRVTAKKPDYFAAHNADFERQFYAGYGVPWLDTYKLALRLWPDAPNHQQGTLLFHLGIEFERERAFPPHRAGPDSYVCALLLREILLHPQRPTFETMVKISDGPALLPRCTLGDYKGKPWSDVPTSFLQWVMNKEKSGKGKFGRDLIANVKLHLKNRGEL